MFITPPVAIRVACRPSQPCDAVLVSCGAGLSIWNLPPLRLSHLLAGQYIYEKSRNASYASGLTIIARTVAGNERSLPTTVNTSVWGSAQPWHSKRVSSVVFSVPSKQWWYTPMGSLLTTWQKYFPNSRDRWASAPRGMSLSTWPHYTHSFNTCWTTATHWRLTLRIKRRLDQRWKRPWYAFYP